MFAGIKLLSQYPKGLNNETLFRASTKGERQSPTFGFFRKYPSSNTASGKGSFSSCKFAYRPVSGDLKSGIPAAVEIPAPVRMTMFLTEQAKVEASAGA